MTTRYDAIANASASYRRFQHITLIKRYKDEGPPPPINLLVALGHAVAALGRRCRLLCRETPPVPSVVQSSFTVYSGFAATRQSERFERSYLRDFLREYEARTLAKGEATADGPLAALPAEVKRLRQTFSERLDRIERSAGGGGSTRLRRFSSHPSECASDGGATAGGASCGASSHAGGSRSSHRTSSELDEASARSSWSSAAAARADTAAAATHDAAAAHDKQVSFLLASPRASNDTRSVGSTDGSLERDVPPACKV